MPITTAVITDRETVRRELVAELRQRKAANPGFRVIDIGGRHNPWADEVTDAYVDVFHFETDKSLYVGDINDEDVWRSVEKDGPFDFAIISHVLEDIRYPMTALRWMPRIAKAGFLGLPNKHTEFSNGVSDYWLGQSHHSWVFTALEDSSEQVLQALPKFACVEYFNHARPGPASRGEPYGTRNLPWLRPELAGRDHEFAARWEGSLPFAVPDYTLDLAAQVDLYRSLLSESVEDPS
jgi:hypothetical protein